MALVFDQPLFRDRAKISEQSTPQEEQLAIDARLQAVLSKKDDRLLRDVGLTREEAIGPVASARAQWARNRALWNL